MAERDGYIPGVPCWIDTSQPDPAAAAGFYGQLFGWELEDVSAEGQPAYLIGRIRGGDVAGIGPIAEGSWQIATWNTYIAVDSADQAAASVSDAGGTVLTAPFDIGDAGRMAVLSDPEGAVFCVWQSRRHRGARVVNEHGAVNFNGLNTRDLESAKAFYGEVFGWRTISLGGGAEAWTLPGYGDHLEAHDPGLRDRVVELGGPVGFEDVVASVNPIPDDQPDVPAHWNVTFGADDADAVAAKATELGGRVILEPLDVPWSRITMIADPAGATFIAGEFVPENRELVAGIDTGAAA